MSTNRPRKMRWWIPVLVILGVGGFIGYLFATENFARYFASLILTFAGTVLVCLWFIFLTGLPWRRRFIYFGFWLALVAVGAFVLGGMTRWEGSTGGGALPRLVWKWSPKSDTVLEELVVREAVNATATTEKAAAFPFFLGAEHTGVLPDLFLEPDWEANPPEELWRRPLGVGWSGFVVANGRAITQEQRGEKELVACYDLLTGEPLWVHENTARFSETMGGDGPRATPTIEGDVVFALGATGILDCLELASGKRIWSRDILEENDAKNVFYGKAGSPLVHGDRVIVTGGDEGGPTLLAYDRHSGDPLWRAGDEPASYATPGVATVAGREQILSQNHRSVTGHDIETGQILWRFDWPGTMPHCSQAWAVSDDHVFVSASYGYGCKLLQISKAEDDAEFPFEVEELAGSLRMKTKFSNVCIHDGHAYGLDEGRLTCLNVMSGERAWRGDRYGYGQNLLAGDLIVVQAEPGYVALVEATPEAYREVARLPALDGKTWNYPALAGEYLIVRNDLEAACYRVPLRK